MVPVRLPSVVAIWLSEVVAICVPHLVAAGLRRVVPIVAIMSWRLVGCQDQAALNATKKNTHSLCTSCRFCSGQVLQSLKDREIDLDNLGMGNLTVEHGK